TVINDFDALEDAPLCFLASAIQFVMHHSVFNVRGNHPESLHEISDYGISTIGMQEYARRRYAPPPSGRRDGKHTIPQFVAPRASGINVRPVHKDVLVRTGPA